MVASVRTFLLQNIDEHLSLYLKQCSACEEEIQAAQQKDAHALREALISQLRLHGATTRLIGEAHPLLYAEFSAGASVTLLFYTRYPLPVAPVRLSSTFSARLAALNYYQQAVEPLAVNIKWLIDVESALNTPHFNALVEVYQELLQADACICDACEQAEEHREGGTERIPVLAVGSKGLMCIELAVQTARSAIPSMHGSVVPNALWRLTWALASLKDAREDILIEGFYDALTSAGDDDIEALRTLPDRTHALTHAWGREQPLLGLQGFQFHYAQRLIPTCTLNSIQSGSEAEIPQAGQLHIPSQASALLDFQLVPDQDPHDIMAKLRHHLDAQGFQDVEARLLYGYPPASTPSTDSFVQKMRAAMVHAYGCEPAILPLAVESIPLSALRHQLGMPVIIAENGYSARKIATAHAYTQAQNATEGAVKDYEQQFAGSMKQLVMLLEEVRHGDDTTQ